MVNKEVGQVAASLRDLHDEAREFSSNRVENAEDEDDKARDGMAWGVDDQPSMALKVLGLHVRHCE